MPAFTTLASFKQRLEIFHDEKDDMLNELLDAAEAYLSDPENGVLGRPVLQQSFTEEFASFSAVKVSNPDLSQLTQIDYVDSGGATQTLGAIASLQPDGTLKLNFGEEWPSDALSVSVTYTAGWVIAPQPIKDAAYFIAATYFEQRSAMSAMPEQLRQRVAMMIGGYRRIGI